LRGWVYEIIKIYSEKFTTNNSENNYKLSYTPKPHLHPFLPEAVLDNPELVLVKIKSHKHWNLPPRKKVTNKKKPTQTASAFSFLYVGNIIFDY